MRHVQLKAFHNVALHGGFSRAAEALFLTQPAISDQVKRLEQQYDVLLFNRYKKQVSLTEQGHRLFQITRQLFEVEARALEFLSETRALTSGKLRIIADSAYHVTGVLGRFRQMHPDIQIFMRSGNTEEVLQALYAYSADIGVSGSLTTGAELQMLELGTTPIVAFAKKGTVLDGRSRASIAELARHPLILREPGSITRARLEQAAAAAGVKLEPAIEAEGREAVREIVASGAGIGFVSEAEYGKDDRLVKIEIAGDQIPMTESLISLKQRSEVKVIKVFMEMARSGAAD